VSFKRRWKILPKVIGHDGIRYIEVDDSDTIKKAIKRIKEQKKLRKKKRGRK